MSDTKTIIQILDEFSAVFGTYMFNIDLVGDKGYMSNDIDKTKYRKFGVELVTPYRENQIKKNTKMKKVN